MRTSWFLSVAVVALGGVVLADDVKKNPEPPQAVVDAVKKKYPGATLGKFDREKKDGKVCFEVDVKITSTEGKAEVKDAKEAAQPRKIEVLLSLEGKILQEKEAIAPAAIPSAVRKGVEATKYAKWLTKHASKVVKDEKTADARFTLLLVEKDQAVSLTLDNDGKVVGEKARKVKNGKVDDDDDDDDDDGDDDKDDDKD